MAALFAFGGRVVREAIRPLWMPAYVIGVLIWLAWKTRGDA
jgi:hypothetical protein